jgi:urease gamma subunit
MGSGQRGNTAAKLARREGLLSRSGSPVVNCDIRARVVADAASALVESAVGQLMRDGNDVAVLVEGVSVAVLRTDEVTEKIASCLSRGQRFIGEISTVEGRVVVDVSPDASA